TGGRGDSLGPAAARLDARTARPLLQRSGLAEAEDLQRLALGDEAPPEGNLDVRRPPLPAEPRALPLVCVAGPRAAIREPLRTPTRLQLVHRRRPRERAPLEHEQNQRRHEPGEHE